MVPLRSSVEVVMSKICHSRGCEATGRQPDGAGLPAACSARRSPAKSPPCRLLFYQTVVPCGGRRHLLCWRSLPVLRPVPLGPARGPARQGLASRRNATARKCVSRQSVGKPESIPFYMAFHRGILMVPFCAEQMCARHSRRQGREQETRPSRRSSVGDAPVTYCVTQPWQCGISTFL